MKVFYAKTYCNTYSSSKVPCSYSLCDDIINRDTALVIAETVELQRTTREANSEVATTYLFSFIAQKCQCCYVIASVRILQRGKKGGKEKE